MRVCWNGTNLVAPFHFVFARIKTYVYMELHKIECRMCMARVVGIGKQSFEKIIKEECFYIDKTAFIKEWWENKGDVTLITRPRRFGKTLNMDMIKCFFSNEYKDRGDLFEGLDIWKEEKYRELQGTYPMIFLSFVEIKTKNFKDTREQICFQIVKMYNENDYLYDSGVLNDNEKKFFKSISMVMSDAVLSVAINQMCCFMHKYYGKKVIILLDEYDTPMQEAYVNGYWEELVGFTRSLFNSTFKTNPYLERAIMTGITKAEYSALGKFAKQTSNGSALAETMSKESIFSDLNNIVVVTTTSDLYETAFGFTEQEVFNALDEFELSDKKDDGNTS